MTNIKKRHFCKSVALLSLVPLLKIDFLSANINDYNTVVIWCERFEEFITAAKYQ